MLRFCSFLSLVLAVSLASCQPDDTGQCNGNVQQDESFDVTVLGRSTPDAAYFPVGVDGRPSCELDDIHKGDRFQVTLAEHFMSGGTALPCREFLCPIDFPAPAEPVESAATLSAGLYVCVGKNAKVRLGPQCELERSVALYHSKHATGLYADADGGEAPPFTLLRALYHPSSQVACDGVMERFPTASAERDPVCVDMWQVRLTKR